MFDRICRENGITHRLTKPRSPTTTGKIERFHLSLRRELLDELPPFRSVADAQAAIDGFRRDYNTDRPHQGIGMAFPADRFQPNSDGLPLKLPPSLTPTADVIPAMPVASPPVPVVAPPIGLAGEVDRAVPASGNMTISGHQFWLGPVLAGQHVTVWVDTTVVHLIRHDGGPAQERSIPVHPRPTATTPGWWRTQSRSTTHRFRTGPVQAGAGDRGRPDDQRLRAARPGRTAAPGGLPPGRTPGDRPPRPRCPAPTRPGPHRAAVVAEPTHPSRPAPAAGCPPDRTCPRHPPRRPCGWIGGSAPRFSIGGRSEDPGRHRPRRPHGHR